MNKVDKEAFAIMRIGGYNVQKVKIVSPVKLYELHNGEKAKYRKVKLVGSLLGVLDVSVERLFDTREEAMEYREHMQELEFEDFIKDKNTKEKFMLEMYYKAIQDEENPLIIDFIREGFKKYTKIENPTISNYRSIDKDEEKTI